MQFRVFGEVSAEVDGRRLEIGHARQRCVLAALVVDVNRPVSVEQLIDRVWADRPPARARNAVAGYLSRLRTLLAGGGVEIGRGPAGYTLVANEDAVDLLRFRRLAAAARIAGDPDEALALYQQALAVGCGEPFAGIATPWFDDMRNAIAAEHLSIFLDRNDAALRAGRHTEILGELEAALQSHPLDERLAGQLMLTQFRCGRQAAALETYRRMRERLVDELGVDPGPALRAVHQQILDSEPADPVPPSRPPPPARAGSLPRRLTSFIGRADEVAAAAAAVRADHVITLTGVGGVGKTRLALEAAERCQDGFEHGAMFCELAPVSDGAAVSSAVAAALGVHEKPGLGVAGTAVEHLRNRNMLLLIDNCEHVLDDAASLIERIARECPAVAVLATSREPLSIDGERVLPVRPLREREAAALFTARARAGRPEFDPDAEPVGAIAEICRRLDGLPLAIELAAARTRVMNSLDIARRLDGLRLLSGNARGAHPRQQSVAATIDWSYRLLAEAEQALFERLSVFAGSFDLEAVHGVCAEPDATEDDTLELLTCLVDKSMVVIRGGALTTRYAVLETLRAYGRERLRDKGLQGTYEKRHARYFVDIVERGHAAMHGPDEAMWIARLAPDAGATIASPDTENLRTAFERVVGDGDVDSAMRLVASMGELMQMRVGYTSTDWTDRAIDIADRDHPLYAEVIGVAARKAWVLGQFARAGELAERADGLVPAAGHTYLGYPADVLADIAFSEGRPAVALAHYQAEVDAARATGNRSRLVWVLYQITIAFDALGTPEAGLAAARQASEAAAATGNPSTLAMACCAMGRAVRPADPDRALQYFADAVGHAAPVQNNWLTGIARMEAAGTRAMHAEPTSVAHELAEILDHWEKAGSGTGAQHWQTMKYVALLLERLGADADAAALHRAIQAAGHQTPGAPAAETPDGAQVLSGAQALALARSSLHARSQPGES